MVSLRIGLLGILLGAVALSGCFDPNPAEGVPCSEDGECPEGQGCDAITNTCSVNPRNCPAGQERCDGQCTDISNDPGHCGECGNACGTDQVCADSQCAAGCPEGQTNCDGSCVDLQSDDANCNACGNACDSDRECRAGSCELKCETFLDAPTQDSWGGYWDGLVREATSHDVAEAECAAFGGRLPTATELYRVSTAVTSDVGDATDTEELWSIVPYDELNQVTGRLSDGALTTENASSGSLAYRCFCPEDRPASFQGTSCYGSPGSECLGLSSDGGRYNMDAMDRPPLRKSAAVWECAFEGGHLARYHQYADVIEQGAAGSNQWLHVFDDVHYQNAALIRWTDSDWVADGNISYTSMTAARAFRCAGVNYGGGVYQGTVDSEFVGTSWKSETADTAGADWVAAHDACLAKGGHLPTSGELHELIQQGLPNGSNAWLFTSDEAGYNGTNFLAVLTRWTGVNRRVNYAYSTSMNWGYRTDASSFGSRCIYYPIDSEYEGPATADCQGGCTEIDVGGGAKMWFDSADRAAATIEAAYGACRSAGGRLATKRDLHEAVRGGLPGGSGALLWSSDMGIGNSSSPLSLVVQWTDVDTAFTGQWSTYSTWSGLTGTRPYRCMWTNELR